MSIADICEVDESNCLIRDSRENRRGSSEEDGVRTRYGEGTTYYPAVGDLRRAVEPVDPRVGVITCSSEIRVLVYVHRSPVTPGDGRR
jgi:hypothetical protein